MERLEQYSKEAYKLGLPGVLLSFEMQFLREQVDVAAAVGHVGEAAGYLSPLLFAEYIASHASMLFGWARKPRQEEGWCSGARGMVVGRT